jgi:hypothetical protein
MLIFKSNDDEYNVFIHIPKNGGKYIRKKITNNKNNQILNNYWGINSMLDLAHIPYIKKNMFITNNIEYKYFTNTRNPYDRIISGFFYKNTNKKIDDFKYFVKNILIKYNFNMSFDYRIIHYYPQYLFVCDENLDIPKNIKIDKLEDVENPKKYDLTKYFNDECLNIINNIYSKDFLYFNYQKLVNVQKCKN